jgi:hypothetical protein
MEMSRRQKMHKKAIAQLDSLIIDMDKAFSRATEVPAISESGEHELEEVKGEPK